ncbi:MAG: HAMP domain-containing histidine kinase [Coriobacteriia bacterium]|nr:HAMP domain-containing histidine kinase [Coriobacteriia bacterium]
MRFRSIRARVALLSTLFAVLLVGCVTVTTYALVARGMSESAEDASVRLGAAALQVVGNEVDAAAAEADRRGLSGAEAEAFIARTALGNAPDLIESGLAYDGAFALYVWDSADSEARLAWSCGDEEYTATSEETLREARSGELVQALVGRRPLVTSLVLRADLGRNLSYFVLDIPGVNAAVLEVAYLPHREEATIDAIRIPMVLVSVVGLVAALFITGLTTGWMLSLVTSLQRAADSVNIGQLDVMLPEEGSHEVAELARSLNGLIDNLRRRNEAQARFIADASHELATPVAGIRGYVNILRAWGAEDLALREEAVSAIDRESRRMARLCSDLLSVIRNEEVSEYRQIRYDMNAVSREVLANAATRYIDKHLEFVGPDEGPLWLYGDPDRIEEALGILVDNACKYTPANGKVSITTRRHRDRVLVAVADTGIGISEEDIPNVFDRFYRSDISRSKDTGGFGLGLAIAEHIVDASSGTITVRSVIDRGTTFEISLPRQKAKS